MSELKAAIVTNMLRRGIEISRDPDREELEDLRRLFKAYDELEEKRLTEYRLRTDLEKRFDARLANDVCDRARALMSEQAGDTEKEKELRALVVELIGLCDALHGRDMVKAKGGSHE